MPRKPAEIRTGAASPLPKHHPARIEMDKANIRDSAASPLPKNHPARTKPVPDVQPDAPTPDVVGHTPSKQAGFTGPQRKTFGQTVQPHAAQIWKGAGNTVNKGSGPVLWIFAACVVIMFMANKNGATINLERAMVGGFFLTLILMAVHAKSPGLATAFAALILIEVVLSYGTTAFKNFSKIGTGTQATPQIASTGATAGAAASLGAVYLGAQAASSAAGGLGSALGSFFGAKAAGSAAADTTAAEAGSESELSKILGDVETGVSDAGEAAASSGE